MIDNAYLTFLQQTFDDFEGATIVKAASGEYVYLNPRALRFMKVKQASDILGKTDKDIKCPRMIYELLNDKETDNFKQYTGIKNISGFKVMYQRINIINKGENTGTIHNLSFVNDKIPSMYELHPDGSMTIFHDNGDRKNLSAKEVDMLKYVVQGYQAKEVVERHNLQYRTIEKNRIKIYHKFGCKTKSETIKKIFKTGLIHLFCE